MPSTQELLQAITGMQQNAQAALPVIPNNGNPRGANNMPNNPDGPVGDAVTSSPYFYEWMKPSPAVDMIQKMLAQPLIPAKSDPIMTKPPNEITSPLVPPKDGIIPRPDDIVGPVIPQRNHAFRNMRRAMREEGDFSYMPKRGQRGITGVEQQQLLPPMPLRSQGF